MSVTVWTKPACGACQQTKTLLKKYQVEFEEKNLLEHPEKLEEFKNSGVTQAPVVEWGGETFSGFSPQKIEGLVDG